MVGRLRQLVVRCYQPRMLLALATLAGAAVAVPQLVRLTGEVRQQPEYLTAVREIQLTPPPPHVPRTILADAIERAGLADPFSKLEPDLAARLHASLEAEPWVEAVRGVLVDRGGVQLHLDYRSPALAVATPTGTFLVDASGVLLPTDSADMLDLDALPRLDGTQRAPVSPAGQRWRNETIVQAAAVTTQLGELWAVCGFVAVRPDADRRWTLVHRSGTLVAWGAADAVATEPTPAQKRQRLEELLAARGSLDGPLRVDLTRWDVIALEPLTVR